MALLRLNLRDVAHHVTLFRGEFDPKKGCTIYISPNVPRVAAIPPEPELQVLLERLNKLREDLDLPPGCEKEPGEPPLDSHEVVIDLGGAEVRLREAGAVLRQHNSPPQVFGQVGAEDLLLLERAIQGRPPQVPATTSQEKAVLEPAVRLKGPGMPVHVHGKEKAPLSKPAYDVVEALLKAGDEGLTKDELDRLSKHGDARKILYRLVKKDKDWARVIKLPGQPGRRYRLG